MGVSEPLRLGDKLREALAEAQRVLDEAKLTGKVTLTTTTGEAAGSVSSVESSMDRTARDAKEAAERSISGDGGPGTASVLGGPNDKLLTALDKLIKALEGSSSGTGGGGRKRQAAPGEPPPSNMDDNGGYGYVNPYILQGLLQNPLGTTQNSIMGMLMGGAGMGLKAPGWLGSMLNGSAGMFKPGMALGAQTQLAGAGISGLYANPMLIAGAKAAVPVAAFGGAMMLQQGWAKDRSQDANDYMDDRRFSQQTGVNWRGGAWDGYYNSRSDIWQKDIREVMGGSGLGFQGMSAHLGDRGTVDAMSGVADKARLLGLDPGAMGGALGAGVRSGTLSINGADAGAQITRYLGLIEGWTSKTAQFGFSSNESLQKMAEISQKGMQGTNILTQPAAVSLMSMDFKARQGLSPALQRGGGDAAMGALGAEAQGETQRVLMMNQFLGADGNLSEEGWATANKAFGSEQVAAVMKRGGKMGGTMIAEALTHTSLGKTRGRALTLQQMDKAGFGGAQAMLAMGSGQGFVADAMGYDAAMRPGFLEDDKSMGTSTATDRFRGVENNEEEELARVSQVIKRLSSMTAESANALQNLALSTHKVTSEMGNFADQLRQFDKAAWKTLILETVLGPGGSAGVTGYRER